MTTINDKLIGQYVCRVLDMEGNELERHEGSNMVVLGMRNSIVPLLGINGNADSIYSTDGIKWIPVVGDLDGAEIPLKNFTGNFRYKLNYTTGKIPAPAYMAFGASNVATNVQMKKLVSQVTSYYGLSQSPVFNNMDTDAPTVTYTITMGPTDYIGETLCEAGLFAEQPASKDKLLLARIVFGPYTRKQGTYFEFTWSVGYSTAERV